jgi:hypothetical protein
VITFVKIGSLELFGRLALTLDPPDFCFLSG